MAAIATTVDVTPGTGTGMGSALLTIAAALTMGNQTSSISMPTLTNTQSPCQVMQVDLVANTEYTVTVPAVAQGVIVTPPQANTALWQYRKTTTVVNQTATKGTLVQPFDGNVPASFFLFCASAVAGFRVIFY
jgi:hypothetical protein